MSKSRFFDKIKNSEIERQVEDVYNEGIAFYFKEVDGSPLKFTYPYSCDGLIETKTGDNKTIKLLMEFKYDCDFTNRVARAKVIVQTLFYVKRFELDGLKLPNIILIGDINECFVFHTNDIIKYLDKNIDWKVAASSAAEKNPDLVLEISNDGDLNPFVFVVNENFSFKTIANKIIDLASNVQRYVHVTEHNISNIFDYFTSRIIKDPKKISPNDIVAIFIGVITDGNNYYVHPKRTNYICTPFGEIQIDAAQYKGFISYFNRKYTPQEKMKFAEISDRLIEDTNRRNKGEFYTPTLFVDYAHKMISEALGDDWRDEYVVWDNCCGTKNLTRDYHFKELYCSTLEKSELDISSKYNPEATSFQFDFLNDDLDKLPKGLLEAFKQNKKIMFFLNPPYGRAGKNNDGAGAMGIKKGSAFTMINEQMKQDKIGACSANLYAQFIYRIMMIKRKYNLTDIHIAMFTPTLYLAGPSWNGFRKEFFNDFTYCNGCTFRASHFADVADSWGIAFSIWYGGKTFVTDCFNHELVDCIDGEICLLGDKTIYNTDSAISGTKWASDVNVKKAENTITLKSALNLGTKILATSGNILSWFTNGCNNVDNNTQDVYFMSAPNDRGKTNIPILPDNFTRCTSLFAARRLVQKNWINWTDEYMKPNTDHPLWQEFENDSIVYSLFESKSNQSSLRQIKYHNKLWDIKNEFFWMSKSEIENLANIHNNDACYSDVHTSEDRFVYKKLKDIKLTPEAQTVLDKACEIVRKTFKYRELFNEEHSEYQINNWDCGWYQIKVLAKEYAKDDLAKFKDLYNKLSDKMRPMVYELGFLK